MQASADDISEKLNRIYNLKGYMDKYGLDVWLTIFLVFMFFVATTYFTIKNKLEPIKADWINQKCNPSYIPFAALINKPVGMSATQYTAENFAGCVQQTLIYVAQAFMAPIYYIMGNLNLLFKTLIEAIASVRAFFSRIRNSMKDITENLFSRLINLTIPLMALQVKVRTIFGQVIGALTASFMVMLGAFTTMKSLFANIVNILIMILILMAVAIIILYIITAIPVFGFISLPILYASILAFFIIALVTILILVLFKEVLNMSSPGVPSCPTGCFAPETPIDMALETPINMVKPISTVEVGDKLKDGAVVTGIIKYTSATQDMYELDGIYVTGQHRVFYKNEWLKAKDHPASRLVSDYKEKQPFLLL